MAKGILIDVENKSIREVEFEGLKGMYANIGCDMVELVRIAKGVDLWIDEEGRCKSRTKGFMLSGGSEPFMGNGLIAGSRGGETTDAKVTVGQVESVVTFIDYDDALMVPEPEITFIPL